MNEQTEDQTPKRKLGLSAKPGRLELKKTVDAGQVRQSFSHGRSKSVTVEVRRKRTFAPTADGGMAEVKTADKIAAELAAGDGALAVEVTEGADAAEEAERVAPPRTLTEEEKAARARALSGAKQAEVEAEVFAIEEAELREREAAAAELRLAEEALRRVEGDAKRRQDEETRRGMDDEAARKAAEQAARLEAREAKAGEQAPGAPERPKAKLKLVDTPAKKIEAEEEEERPQRAKRAGRPEPRRLTPKRGEARRRTGRLTIAQALDDEEKMRSLASLRRSREREKRAQQMPEEGTKIIRDVVIPETITVQELSNRMAERGTDVIKALMRMDVMATVNQALDADIAELVVAEFGHRVRRVSEADVEIGFMGEADREPDMRPRPPVVTVMGHVDHGKTSLLDALRETDVVASEAGGITQHIGAYQVRLGSGDSITFIDTPGHAAFTSMRARGATVTDIVVLVVAADDGIMPQTVEAIDHARAAKVPIIVAINKIDLPDADLTRVRNGLLQHELVVEELGGDVLAVEVSATEKTNLAKLEEAILLQAEVMELKANPDRSAEGTVIEAKIERGRGPVATMLVARGTLDVGDIVVAGEAWGRVRALIADNGTQIKAAVPSMPVEVVGLNGTPMAGDEFAVVGNEARAREITEFRQRRSRDAKVAVASRGSLEQMFSKAEGEGRKDLAIVIKADTQGSVEAIQASAEKLNTDEVGVSVLHTGVGGINESDVTLAKASGAMVIGFNVRANPQAGDLAAVEGVEFRYYSVIYQIIDDIKALLSGMLPPSSREHFLGNAAIQEVFNISKVGKIAGCRVTDGMVKRGASVRLLRDSVVVYEGTLSSLKRFKDEVREVREGFECGMAFENYQDIKANDVIECFEVEVVARTL